MLQWVYASLIQTHHSLQELPVWSRLSPWVTHWLLAIMNRQPCEDASGSCNLSSRFQQFIGKHGLIPAAHSGTEVNEHNSRQKQLQIQKNKENQQGNTHVELKNLWSSFLLGHYFCCQRGHTLPKRDSSSVTADSCCFLLELDKDSHHPKTLSDANNTNKVYSTPHFQQLPASSSLPAWCVFIRASLPCNSTHNSC